MAVPIELEIFMKDLTREGLAGVKGSIADVEDQTRQLILVLEQALAEQKRLYKENKAAGIDTSGDVKNIQALQGQIAGLKAGLDDLTKAKQKSNSTPVIDDEAVARSTQNLKFQFQQVARELPSLAMGPQMFILAISNNLPMLADAIERVKAANESLKASGAAGVPIWKQLLSSLFSWQTALTVGITLLIMYSGKIWEWVKGLFGATEASKEAAEAQKTYNKAMMDASDTYTKTLSQNAATNIAKYRALQSEYNALAGNMAAKKKFIKDNQDAFRQLGISVDGVGAAEKLFNGNTGAIISSFMARAKAAAAAAAAISYYQQAFALGQKKVHFIKPGTQLSGSEFRKTFGYDPDWNRQYAGNKGTLGMTPYFTVTEEDSRRQAARLAAPIKELQRNLRQSGDAMIKQQTAYTLKADEDIRKSGLKNYESETPSTHGSRNNTALDREKRLAEQLKRQQKETAEELREEQLRNQQAEIDLMADGADKKQKQLDLDYRRQMDKIAVLEKDWRDKQKGKLTKEQAATLTDSREQVRDTYIKGVVDIDKEESEKQTEELQKLLDKYQDFNARRKKIEEEGNSDIANLRKRRTKDNAAEIDASIKVATDKIRKEIQSVNDEEAASVSKDSGFLKDLFGDISSMSFDHLQILIKKAKELRNYLNGKGERTDVLDFISDDDLKKIEKSPAELDKLRKALDKLLDSKGKEDKWKIIFDNFKNGLAELQSGENFTDISSAIGKISGAAGAAGDEIAKMLRTMGKNSAADAVEGVSGILNAVSAIGEGFAKGGLIGGIAAAVGQLAGALGKAFSAEARHKAALKEIMNETIAQQRHYNLLLLQQNALYEKGTTIFGTDTYAKALNSITVMKEAQEELNKALLGTEQQQERFSKNSYNLPSLYKAAIGLTGVYSSLKDTYSGLADVQIVTGHKKTGLFGWGNGKDTYSSILDVYPELINENGKLNISLAESVIQTRKMSDESKSTLQNMIDLAKQAEESYQGLKDYLTDIFGELGSSITDALVKAFENGGDAATDFVSSVSSMLETLAKQMVYSISFRPLFEKAQQAMLDITTNGNLSDTQRFEQYADIIGRLTGNLKTAIPEANELLKLFQDEAKKQGVDIFRPESSTETQSGQSGAFTAMSQDTGAKLEGLFTSVQDHLSSIDKIASRIELAQRDDIKYLTIIADNTAYCKFIEPIYELMQKFDRDGLTVK